MGGRPDLGPINPPPFPLLTHISWHFLRAQSFLAVFGSVNAPSPS